MRRRTSRLVLVLAAVLGIAVGGLAFVEVGALSIRSGPEPGRGPTTATTSAPGSPTSAPRPSTGASPTGASPTGASSPSTTAPPFTAQALLQPGEFEERGWGTTAVLRTWDGYPDRQISSCTALRRSDGRPVAAYTALYRGSTTTAVETVVRFDSERAATSAMTRVRARIEACATEPAGDPALGVQTIDADAPAGLDAREMWDATGTDAQAEGFVALVRAQDRIAFVTMISLETDPLVTTDYASLALLAGQRLV